MSSNIRRCSAALVGGLVMAVWLLPAATASAQVPVPWRAPQDLRLEVLSTQTQDPTAIDVAPDGRVIWTERKGTVKVRRPDGTVVQAGRLAVAANECADCPDNLNEGGLHGILLDRDFETSGGLYLYYAVPGSLGRAPSPAKHASAGGTQAKEGLFRLSHFTLSDDNVLDMASERVILENAVEWFQCCHYGGDLDWMPDGTIVLSSADDTNPFESNGYSPIDERPDREAFNAQRTSGNPADRRGKVLRLNPDGSVPADNPHVGDANYDPYVYAMGFRSNYRIAVDPTSGAVYVGNVGPDARNPNPTRGPMGYDELEIIPPGGGTDHGWPYCIGPNTPYIDYDFATQTSGQPFDCTGKVPAAFHYSYTPENNLLYPQFGQSGGRTAIAGLVYKAPANAPLALPSRLNNKLLFSEWSRNLIVSIPVGANGALDTTPMAQLQEQISTIHAHDMAIGPDGAVYMVEYGSGFWNNTNSRVSRIVPASAPAQAPRLRAGVAGDVIPGGPWVAGVAVAVLLVGAALKRRKEVVQ